MDRRGILPLTSRLYPRGPWDLGDRVHRLPADRRVPYLPDWRWVPTPGHSPGHVSFWRESDGTLIAGDAFVTTRQESALSVLTQAQHVQGPPSFFTHDWTSARESVRKLRDLQPSIAATGHGTPMWGRRLREQLDELVEHFDQLAVPRHGRYVRHPVQADETGPTYVPPARVAPLVVMAGSVLVAGALMWAAGRRRE